MSVITIGKYLGNKKVEIVHLDTGSSILSDAPKDHKGEGTTFSPTDLFATSLAACMVTVIGIVAENKGINVEGMHYRCEKLMLKEPRRVGNLNIDIHLPSASSPKERQILEKTAHTCPVHNSIHPEIELNLKFLYDV